MNERERELEQRLGYEFADKALLRRALTHRSGGRLHNERLEFLGDAVLGFVVSAELFRRFPDAAESDLTVMRSWLVRREALAELARRLRLGEVLHVGVGERKTAVAQRDSVLADAFEALVGAVYQDGGYRQCLSSVRKLLADQWDSIAERAVKDAKTQLQEYLQGRGAALPVYERVSAGSGENDAPFLVRCRISRPNLQAEAVAGDIKTAEQQAAALVLAQIAERSA